MLFNGAALEAWRQRRRLTRASLAEVVEVRPSVIAGLESDRLGASPEMVRRLAAALDIEPDDLLRHRRGRS